MYLSSEKVNIYYYSKTGGIRMSNKKKKQNSKSYKDIKKIAETPLSERVMVESARGEKVMPRRFHHTAKSKEKVKKIFNGITKDIENNDRCRELAGENFYLPFRPTGPYAGAVLSLYILGANSYHTLKDVKVEMQKYLSRVGLDKENRYAWQRFEGKLPREGAFVARDIYGRIHDNMRVLQRLGGQNPYGMKLADMNCCIDIKRDADGTWSYRLNTFFNSKQSHPQLNCFAYYEALENRKESLRVAMLAKKQVIEHNKEVIEEMGAGEKTTPSSLDA